MNPSSALAPARYSAGVPGPLAGGTAAAARTPPHEHQITYRPLGSSNEAAHPDNRIDHVIADEPTVR